MEADTLSLAKELVRRLNERKVQDLRVINVSRLTVLFDCFVIVTARNTVHIQALLDELEKWRIEEQGPKTLSREGDPQSGWVLADYGRVILHVFLPEIRSYYNLENLWGDGVEMHLDESDKTS